MSTPLVSFDDLTIGFRGPSLLDSVGGKIHVGDKIGLLGRNGAGKTTFMRLLVGEQEPDHGTIRFAPETKIALLDQNVPTDVEETISDVVAQGISVRPDEPDWQADQMLEKILSQMNLDGTRAFSELSSGMKRRVLLAKALVSKPDLLLLDEPTNHLDLDSITWVESFLQSWKGTLLFVTHDRIFLQHLANRILEIEGGRIFDWACDYSTFLKRKAAALEAEEKQNALFDKKLAQEEAWIRQGIKARRTRNEGRVRALEQLRRERQARRDKVGKVNLAIQDAARSGDVVAVGDGLGFSYGDVPIFKDVNVSIMRGDKIGVIGPNGVGKTTLLKVLLGRLDPTVGQLKRGTNIQIAYFDQLRDQLDPEQTVQENVGDGYETITIQGRSKHVLGYLQDFLFTPERARTQIRFLSGGERNRVLLAKLFAKPANLLVMDEPTNDLDTETLELLEEQLTNYNGTLLLVSHDRAFLNNVVTSTLAYEDGTFVEYSGGYDDWLRQIEQKQAEEESQKPIKEKPAKESVAKPKSASSGKRKLSNKERSELESLPAKIESLESAIAERHEAMGQPDFYQQPPEKLSEASKQLEQLETELATAFERWEELEQLQEG